MIRAGGDCSKPQKKRRKEERRRRRSRSRKKNTQDTLKCDCGCCEHSEQRLFCLNSSQRGICCWYTKTICLRDGDCTTQLTIVSTHRDIWTRLVATKLSRRALLNAELRLPAAVVQGLSNYCRPPNQVFSLGFTLHGRVTQTLFSCPLYPLGTTR